MRKRWAFHLGFLLVAGGYLLDLVLALTITLYPLLFVGLYVRAWVVAMLWPGFQAFRDLRSRPIPATLGP